MRYSNKYVSSINRRGLFLFYTILWLLAAIIGQRAGSSICLYKFNEIAHKSSQPLVITHSLSVKADLTSVLHVHNYYVTPH